MTLASTGHEPAARVPGIAPPAPATLRAPVRDILDRMAGYFRDRGDFVSDDTSIAFHNRFARTAIRFTPVPPCRSGFSRDPAAFKGRG